MGWPSSGGKASRLGWAVPPLSPSLCPQAAATLRRGSREGSRLDWGRFLSPPGRPKGLPSSSFPLTGRLRVLTVLGLLPFVARVAWDLPGIHVSPLSQPASARPCLPRGGQWHCPLGLRCASTLCVLGTPFEAAVRADAPGERQAPWRLCTRLSPWLLTFVPKYFTPSNNLHPSVRGPVLGSEPRRDCSASPPPEVRQKGQRPPLQQWKRL